MRFIEEDTKMTKPNKPTKKPVRKTVKVKWKNMDDAMPVKKSHPDPARPLGASGHWASVQDSTVPTATGAEQEATPMQGETIQNGDDLCRKMNAEHKASGQPMIGEMPAPIHHAHEYWDSGYKAGFSEGEDQFKLSSFIMGVLLSFVCFVIVVLVTHG